MFLRPATSYYKTRQSNYSRTGKIHLAGRYRGMRAGYRPREKEVRSFKSQFNRRWRTLRSRKVGIRTRVRNWQRFGSGSFLYPVPIDGALLYISIAVLLESLGGSSMLSKSCTSFGRLSLIARENSLNIYNTR